MDIKYRSIRIIDYASEKFYKREIPESFDEYITELITHLKENNSVREYKTISNKTEVIGCILDTINKVEDEDSFEINSDTIANRLLLKEVETQKKINQMNVSVKKGSLIQALIYDDVDKQYYYLLAKVEHSDFVDDEDFTFKTGFSKNKKTIWKSCLFDINDLEVNDFLAKVFSDTEAKYWSKKFLELEEIITDESNTLNAFNSIERVLNRTIKEYSKSDYTYIRNSVIVYFRNHEYLDYNKMIEELFENYNPEELNEIVYNDFLNKLKELPEKKGFDIQFNVVPELLKRRIKKYYQVNNSIGIVLNDGIEDIKNIIYSVEKTDGERFIYIKTDDEDTYNFFKLNK